MNNTTTAVAKPYDTAYALTQTTYAVFGTVDLLCNLIVAVTILFTAKFRTRNELLILAVFTMADGLYGFCYMVLGARRLRLFAIGDMQLVSALDVLKEFQTSLTIFAPEMMSLMLFSVSVDRLIFITRYDLYSSLGWCYVATMICIPAFIAGATVSACWTCVLIAGSPTLAFYKTSTFNLILPKAVYNYHFSVLIIGGTLAIFTYAIVMLIMKFKTKSQFGKIQERQIARQHKLTKILCLMSCTSFVTFVLPNMALLVLPKLYNGPLLQSVVLALYFVILLHSICNIGCYLSRPSDVRTEILRRLRCMKASAASIAAENSPNLHHPASSHAAAASNQILVASNFSANHAMDAMEYNYSSQRPSSSIDVQLI